jgi:enoyl-CoA hydratase/carnithine racemase
MEQPLLMQREGAVLILTNNNPLARNALSPGLYADLQQALRDAANDPTLGAIVLTGQGGQFCAGGDLHLLAKRRELPIEERRAKMEALHETLRALRDCPKPIVAAVEGAAAGGGFALALACDMLVAAKNAVFTVAQVKIGLTPDAGVSAFLAEFVSRQLLTELCLTGERMSGERLHQLGCVNRLTDPGNALQVSMALAGQIGSGPMQAMADIKTLCRQAQYNSLEQQLELEAQFMVKAQGSEESREGISAFLEKRVPDYNKLRQKRSDDSDLIV